MNQSPGHYGDKNRDYGAYYLPGKGIGLLALLLAVAVHLGLAVAVLYSSPAPSNSEPPPPPKGLAGIEIGLGPGAAVEDDAAIYQMPKPEAKQGNPLKPLTPLPSTALALPVNAAETPIPTPLSEPQPSLTAQVKASPKPLVKKTEKIQAPPRLQEPRAMQPAVLDKATEHSAETSNSPLSPRFVEATELSNTSTSAKLARASNSQSSTELSTDKPPIPQPAKPQASNATVGREAAGKIKNAEGRGDGAAGAMPDIMSSYAIALQTWLGRYKEYPRRARSRRQQGTVLLYFRVNRTGQVLDYKIRKSSGYRLLDNEVVAMVERAQPLPPMPDAINQNRLELVVPVEFFIR